MAGNSFGQAFRITTAGESHGKGNVVIIDGCPPGIEFSEADIQGKNGREQLAKALTASINEKLIALEDFGGVSEVHFTSFVLQ